MDVLYSVSIVVIIFFYKYLLLLFVLFNSMIVFMICNLLKKYLINPDDFSVYFQCCAIRKCLEKCDNTSPNYKWMTHFMWIPCDKSLSLPLIYGLPPYLCLYFFPGDQQYLSKYNSKQLTNRNSEVNVPLLGPYQFGPIGFCYIQKLDVGSVDVGRGLAKDG